MNRNPQSPTEKTGLRPQKACRLHPRPVRKNPPAAKAARRTVTRKAPRRKTGLRPQKACRCAPLFRTVRKNPPAAKAARRTVTRKAPRRKTGLRPQKACRFAPFSAPCGKIRRRKSGSANRNPQSPTEKNRAAPAKGLPLCALFRPVRKKSARRKSGSANLFHGKKPGCARKKACRFAPLFRPVRKNPPADCPIFFEAAESQKTEKTAAVFCGEKYFAAF